MRDEATFRVKAGLAEMLKGGVIMDVVDAEQAKIAEDAGGLRRAVTTLLTDPAYAGVATAMAVEVARLPPAGEAIEVLCEALATFAV